MELSEQELVRRQSLQSMRALGIDPYPAAEYKVTGYSTDIKTSFVDEDTTATWYTGKEVRIAGRLMSRRIMGKASFIEIQDSKGTRGFLHHHLYLFLVFKGKGVHGFEWF